MVNKSLELLNSTLGKYFDLPKRNGEIGLEIECEAEPGDEPLPIAGRELMYWKSDADGSLRNGVEYILKQPIRMTHLTEALAEWAILTKKARFRTSIRTSTHVHFNALNFSLKQIYSIFAAYFLVENILVHMHGPTREGNLFCLRAKDAEQLITALVNEIKAGQYFLNTTSDTFRYAAINPAALRKYGSIELRFLRGTTDTEEIYAWVRELYSLVLQSSNMSVSDILKLYENSSNEDFLRKFFSEKFTELLFHVVGRSTVSSMMLENAPYVVQLNKALFEKNFLFKKPLIYSNHEDVELGVEEPKVKVKKGIKTMDPGTTWTTTFNLDDLTPVLNRPSRRPWRTTPEQEPSREAIADDILNTWIEENTTTTTEEQEEF